MPGDSYDKSLIGLAGEYHVLAQLAERGLVGALTLGHTKGVDILVANPINGYVYKLEVKTTKNKPRRSTLFGEGRFFSWCMSAKHETPPPGNCYYCFVYLEAPGHCPRFFIVSAQEVAEYVKWQHHHWLQTRLDPIASDSSMRQFRIHESDPNQYENRWDLFSGMPDRTP